MEQSVVTVFCASSTRVSPVYVRDAEVLAQQLVENGFAVKYGGGAVGLMGAVANKVLELKGTIIGVIPKFMIEVEWQHPQVERMVVTETMHQRKQALADGVAAVVALPGSSGTLEELIEVISMKKLGLFSKPIIIVNTNGFYNPLIQQLERMADENFMRPEHLTAFTVVDEAALVVKALTETPEWPANAIQFAAV